MIKTLRITSIIAVVLAVVFFVLPAVFGVRGDEQIEQFLNSAGVIGSFSEVRSDEVKDSQREISPLIEQAEAFALYLNPPPKPKPKVGSSVPRSKPRPKGPVSPKFKLIGTSRYELHPELSLALIDEAGKGLRWVRQSSKAGHLIIEQVKDGLVVVRDGERTFELVAERPKKRSLLKERSRVTSGKLPEAQMDAEEKAEFKKIFAELETTPPTAEEIALMEKLTRDRQTMPRDVKFGKTGLRPRSEEIAAARERLISELETMRISAEEARRLGRLGRRLKDVQWEPNRVEDDSTESDANLIEPNLSDLDFNELDLNAPDLNELDLNEPDLNDVNIPG